MALGSAGHPGPCRGTGDPGQQGRVRARREHPASNPRQAEVRPLCSGYTPGRRPAPAVHSPSGLRGGPQRVLFPPCCPWLVLTLLEVALPQQGSSACRVCPLSVSFVEVARWCPAWSDSVHWVCWFWGVSGGAGQGQLLPGPFCRAPGLNCRVTCRWLWFVLGLEAPGSS